MAEFQADSDKVAGHGYFPTSQTWVPGSYGRDEFLLAILLCLVLVGILVFIYMIIVKPNGTLSVTYEFREVVAGAPKAMPVEEKTCPKCAEQVKSAAIVCRFCGHNFGPVAVTAL